VRRRNLPRSAATATPETTGRFGFAASRQVANVAPIESCTTQGRNE